MNKNKIYLLFSCFVIALAFTACSKDDKLELNFLNVSIDSFTFDATGTNELTIDIQANPSWSIIKPYEIDWLMETDRGENFIAYKASPNESFENRATELIVESGNTIKTIQVEQLKQSTPSPYQRLDESISSVISRNGKYIAYTLKKRINKNSEEFKLILLDITSNEEKEVCSSSDKIDLFCIADNGDITLYFENTKELVSYDSSNQKRIIEMPEGTTLPIINGVSANGSVLVGAVRDNKTLLLYPTKWVNRKAQLLSMPQLNILSTQKTSDGAEALGCSSDGSIIYGATATEHYPLYWKDNTVDYIGKELASEKKVFEYINGWPINYTMIEGLRASIPNHSISTNDRYIALEYKSVRNLQLFVTPAIYNTETDEINYLSFSDLPTSKEGSHRATSTFVTDDGSLFYGFINDLNLIEEGYYYNKNNKKSVPAYQYISEEFGLILKDYKVFVRHISSDKQTIFGSILTTDNYRYNYTPWYVSK